MYKNRTSIQKKTFFALALICLGFTLWCCKLQALPLSIFKKQNQIHAIGLSPKILDLALRAYNKAKLSGHATKETLTIVDYSLPSTERRLWVINLKTNEVLFHTYVSHGIASGENFATKFSNRPGSRMSSLGVYETGSMYMGHYGMSLNLFGLEDKFNSNAHSRRIVFHKAHYVDEAVIRRSGRLGRSFGCLALNTKVAEKIMHTIKDGSLLFCYYPDKNWLKESKYL